MRRPIGVVCCLVGMTSVTGVGTGAVTLANNGTSVSTPAVSLTPTAAAGARTGHVITFTTPATGGLSGASGGKVTITFPAGTGLSALSNATVTDTTTATMVGNGGSGSTTTETLSLFGSSVVNAGDTLKA